MTTEALQLEYSALRHEAEFLAGNAHDSTRRAIVLTRLFHDSGGNHLFPLIAAHGALWAYSYFEVGGVLGRLIARRYFYDPRERAYRLSLLNQFAEAFRDVNRQVCVDTYTNYFFTRRFGQHPEAAQFVHPQVLDALNRVHATRERGGSLEIDEQRDIFEQCFRIEQELTVAPGVEAAVKEFDCRIMKFLALRPVVRFTYFPAGKTLLFRDFGSMPERVEKGLCAYQWAQAVGVERVFSTMRDYGLLPPRFWESSTACFDEMRAQFRRA